MNQNRRFPASCIRDGVGYDLAFAKESVGSGWHGILERLFAAKPEWLQVIQVKEKFGGLRFYIDDGTVRLDLLGVGGRVSFEVPAEGATLSDERASQLQDFRSLIQAAEAESYTVCEDCGAPGVTASAGRVLTLCPTCLDRHKAEQLAKYGPIEPDAQESCE